MKMHEQFWNELVSVLPVVVEGTDVCLCIAVQFVGGAPLGVVAGVSLERVWRQT